jgi:uncharacterized protein (TIGR03382 family)
MKAVLLLLSLLLATPAPAYNLNTIASDSCHEKLTLEALGAVLQAFSARMIPVPDNDVLSRLLGSVSLLDGLDLNEGEKFIVLSVVIGVRSPDTDGHSTLDLAALRRLHADPEAVGQYAHALRGPNDDYIAGDIAAVDGTLEVIRHELDGFFAISDPADPAALGERAFFIEHYGRVDVPVFLPAYHLGRAIHALQGAHAHMVWNDDITHVVHVLNYVDAVNSVRTTERDGLAHSGALDDCNRNDTQPMVDRAKRRSAALTAALLHSITDGDRHRVEVGLNPCPADLSELPPLPDNAPEDTPITITCGWLVYNPACRAAFEANDPVAMDETCCTEANAYCGSKFAPIAKTEPAGPYLGCQSTPATASWLLALVLLLGLRRRGVFLAAPVLLLTLAPSARAESTRAFAAVEGHGSFLSDTPNGSLLDVTFGYSARGGYRWDRWRAVVHLEQNAWLRTEFGAAVDAGTFNLGVGAEVLLFDDFIRVALIAGPSFLLFDTVLDKSGTTGLFAEARPIGFRYNVAERVVVTFDPMTFAIVWPVLSDPPLRKVEHRTYVGVEFGFL